ncbi:MAG: peptidoglycan editing factor PgeF [Lysobacteraceae bacterium]
MNRVAGFLPADWPAPPGVHAGTTLRDGPGVSLPPFERFNLGAHCGDDPAAVAANRQRLEPMLDLPAAPCWLRQVHGIEVHRFEQPSDEPPQADASVTDRRGLPLAILSADCLPALFCNRRGDEIGAAHAGWRGLVAGVLEATVRAMRSAPEDLLVWLGPAAGAQRYEIGEEVRTACLDADPQATGCFLPTRPGHWRMDLYALAHRRLAAAGVTAVYGGGLCTLSDPLHFFSYRRDGRGGRMASLIWLR